MACVARERNERRRCFNVAMPDRVTSKVVEFDELRVANVAATFDGRPTDTG